MANVGIMSTKLANLAIPKCLVETVVVGPALLRRKRAPSFPRGPTVAVSI